MSVRKKNPFSIYMTESGNNDITSAVSAHHALDEWPLCRKYDYYYILLYVAVIVLDAAARPRCYIYQLIKI